MDHIVENACCTKQSRSIMHASSIDIFAQMKFASMHTKQLAQNNAHIQFLERKHIHLSKRKKSVSW